ncbi:MAG: outer membrane protein assembly factor BamD [Bryobacteraceae bacterium]
MLLNKPILRAVCVLAAIAGLLTSGCFRRKKYENPITKDTLQPDKVLFDKAMNDVERGRYEVARITLNTLINTYDTSEFLAKAKLLIADSWYREGGSHGLAQAEAEFKDFILFYPTMEESAEAQEKVCTIHYNQMEKADRDETHALRAEDECRQVLTQFPNSKFAPQAQQRLRDIQEVLAEGEYRTGHFYHTKGSHPAAANRLQGLTDHFPLYSQSDEALWELADSYSRMGPRFRDKMIAAYSKLVKDYPLSSRVEDAKAALTRAEAPVPEADPVALARMKYEVENRTKPGLMSPVWDVLKKSPDMRMAAKSGTPVMESYQPAIPASVPAAAAGRETAINAEVSVQTVTDPTALDTKPDARLNPPAQNQTQAQPGQTPSPDAQTGGEKLPASTPEASAEQPLPTNHPQPPVKAKGKKQKNKKTSSTK